MNVLSAELGGGHGGRVSGGIAGEGGQNETPGSVCALGRRVRTGETERCGAGRLHVCLCAGGAGPCGAPGAVSARRGRGLGAERFTPRRAPACTHARARPTPGLRRRGSGTAAPAHWPAAAKGAGRGRVSPVQGPPDPGGLGGPRPGGEKGDV